MDADTDRTYPSPDQLARTVRQFLVALLALAVLASVSIAPVAGATSHDDAEPSFAVELDDDGDATVTLTMTYDLTDDDDRAAFQSLEDGDADQEDALQRFASRLDDVAADVNERTDRSTSVSAAAVSTTSTDDVGALRLSVTWSNLATEEDGALVLEEPFASGFEAEQSLTVVAPEGYEITSATPSPDASDEHSMTWDAGSDLEGFELTVAESADDGLPGFGIVAGIVGLLAAIAVARAATQSS